MEGPLTRAKHRESFRIFDVNIGQFGTDIYQYASSNNMQDPVTESCIVADPKSISLNSLDLVVDFLLSKKLIL